MHWLCHLPDNINMLVFMVITLFPVVRMELIGLLLQLVTQELMVIGKQLQLHQMDNMFVLADIIHICMFLPTMAQLLLQLQHLVR